MTQPPSLPGIPTPATPLPWFTCPPALYGDPTNPGPTIEALKKNQSYALFAANTLPQVERERDAAQKRVRELEEGLAIAATKLEDAELERSAKFARSLLEKKGE